MTYMDNMTIFVLGSDAVDIHLSTGVRQGNALSSTIFNLAVEPLLRKAAGGRGFSALGVEVKTTAYADDIALVAAGPNELQDTLARYRRLLHKNRLDLLPLEGYSWCSAADKTCRRCREEVKNASHITNTASWDLLCLPRDIMQF